MIACEVNFPQKPYLNITSASVQSEKVVFSNAQFQRCFVQPENHHLAFFSEEGDREPFHEFSIIGLKAQLNSSSDLLIITSKTKSDTPLLQVQADTKDLEDLNEFCQGNSDESLSWSPLVYTPSDRPRDSYLSQKDRTSSSNGLTNLGIIAIIFTLVRDAIANIKTYGILPPEAVVLPSIPEFFYGIACFTGLTILMIIFEKLAFKGFIPRALIILIEVLIAASAYALPVFFCYYFKPDTLFALGYIGWCIMMTMKMISYMHVMNEIRRVLPKFLNPEDSNGQPLKRSRRCEVSKENSLIIQNHSEDISSIVNIKEILYFYFAPTLTYQLWYPRTSKIRGWWLARELFQFAVCVIIFVFWLNQFVAPLMRSAGRIFQTDSTVEKVETLLLMSSTFIVVWSTFSYLFFHLFTNILAEVMHFADRDFYRDWWNSNKLRHFWNKWNLPVHRWCQRHLYYPLLRFGFSKNLGVVAVFLFSGLMHEYLFSVPLRIHTFYSVVLFVGQAPLLIIERKYDNVFEKYHIGNIFLWAVIWFLLTPLGVIAYYTMYLKSIE